MAVRRIINREYICRLCGKVRRAPAHYIPDAPSVPQCCHHEMGLLSYEQAVASVRMTDKERAAWYARGGEVERRGGKRQWKAVG